MEAVAAHEQALQHVGFVVGAASLRYDRDCSCSTEATKAVSLKDGVDEDEQARHSAFLRSEQSAILQAYGDRNGFVTWIGALLCATVPEQVLREWG